MRLGYSHTRMREVSMYEAMYVRGDVSESGC